MLQLEDINTKLYRAAHIFAVSSYWTKLLSSTMKILANDIIAGRPAAPGGVSILQSFPPMLHAFISPLPPHSSPPSSPLRRRRRLSGPRAPPSFEQAGRGSEDWCVCSLEP